MTVLGGREIHPINVRVGGFYRAPARRELAPLAELMRRARIRRSRPSAGWRASIFPISNATTSSSLSGIPTEYPLNEGRIVSSRGLDISVSEYEDHFIEEHVPHSNALHSILRGQGSYFVGPLARYTLNFDRLPPLVQEAARDAGLGPVVNNPFQSIVVRSLEILYACDEALRIIETYEPPAESFVPVQPRAASGYGASEAPRGILFHRYRLDATGAIADAKIVPPTSQNQRAIEEDLRGFVESHLGLPEDQLTWQCEQAIRNYDPCISCATHFLKLELDRDQAERPC